MKRNQEAKYWWDTFSETGSIGAYLVYRSILQKEAEHDPSEG